MNPEGFAFTYSLDLLSLNSYIFTIDFFILIMYNINVIKREKFIEKR